jgi:hypothetical protein
MKAAAGGGVSPNQALVEAIYFTGLRKAGVPEDEPGDSAGQFWYVEPASPSAGR